MLKIHKVTGLMYLCKTSSMNMQKCFTYNGSGKYWKRHLKVHGCEIDTIILEVCDTRLELTQKGILWSKLFDVVKSDRFANLVEERGDGGPTMLGKRITEEQNMKKKVSLKQFYSSVSTEYTERRRQINSKSHEHFVYHTPVGSFTNSFEAAKAINCSHATICNRCTRDVDKPITSRKYWRYGWKNKTWRQLGWYRLDSKC